MQLETMFLKEERTEVKVVCPAGGTSKNSNENKTNNTPAVKNDLLEQIITHQQLRAAAQTISKCPK